MNTITFRKRWRTTYLRMHAAVKSPQRRLALSRPALWKRLAIAGWVVYRASDLRRDRGTPGMAFDAIVVVLLLVLGAANLLV